MYYDIIENNFDLFSKQLLKDLLKVYTPDRNLVILCIGTDRATGDCLGPLVGNNLTVNQSINNNIYIYGTLENPVHAKNLPQNIAQINKLNNPFVITVDACLGHIENVGKVTFGYGPIRPGAGVNKNLPEIGNFHINGIVNISGFMEFILLQNTRLNLVYKMARFISNGLFYTIDQFQKEKAYLL